MRKKLVTIDGAKQLVIICDTQSILIRAISITNKRHITGES